MTSKTCLVVELLLCRKPLNSQDIKYVYITVSRIHIIIRIKRMIYFLKIGLLKS
jgi:hypothetical protein